MIANQNLSKKFFSPRGRGDFDPPPPPTSFVNLLDKIIPFSNVSFASPSKSDQIILSQSKKVSSTIFHSINFLTQGETIKMCDMTQKCVI